MKIQKRALFPRKLDRLVAVVALSFALMGSSGNTEKETCSPSDGDINCPRVRALVRKPW